MIEECEKIRHEFLLSQVEKIFPVLFESKEKDGMILGHTANYTPVKVLAKHELIGKIVDVRLTGVGKDWNIGEVI